MKSITSVITIILFLITGFTSNPGDKYPGVEKISGDNLIKTVEFLASPELKGRLAGSEGFYKAAEFMAGEFKSLGLKPAGNEGYYQTFTTEYNEIVAPCGFSLSNKDGSEKKYKLGEDFICRGFTGSGKVSAEIVFAGYGFSDAENNFDEYAGIDANGKIVMMFKQTPSWKIKDKEWNQSLRYRGSIALKHGAAGVIFVSKPNDANPQKPIGSVMDGEGEHLISLPMIHADLNAVDDILGVEGKNIKALQTELDEKKTPISFSTNTKVSIEVTALYTKDRRTMNVAGILEGSGTELKNEYLIIGAHLDHVGDQAGEVYFPGANDNASGSASVLELARTFVKSGIKPKRSIMFILFSNEESGLLGSSYYCKNPIVPVEKTVAMLNNDCVGFGDSIQIGNGKSAPGLWQITRTIDSLYTKAMIMRTWNGGGADAAPFHQLKIPCLYFVSYFSYTFLHLPGDKPETLNKSTFEKECKLAYMTAFEIANGNYSKEKVTD
ncbi:MAG: M20/M25/M40 family metallo-hydrolase [Ignavibacteria bacterium]|nr:M20/M25/M40 family metallo-hydrolase [Ignavibacteria bacterium]